MNEELIKRLQYIADTDDAKFSEIAPTLREAISGVREGNIDEEVLRSILTCVHYDMVDAVESDIRNRLFITRAADQVNAEGRKLICPLCEADRLKEPCHGSNIIDCPMTGTAAVAPQSSQPAATVQVPMEPLRLHLGYRPHAVSAALVFEWMDYSDQLKAMLRAAQEAK